MKPLIHGAPTPVDAATIRELARQDMTARRADLHAALTAEDWPRVAKIAHYLATTADLLDDTELRAACVQAVREGDVARARTTAARVAPGPP